MSAVKPMPAAFNLSESELAHLMRLMDATSAAQVSINRRKHARYAHVCRDIQFKVVQPGGGTTDRLVICRDLAAGGVQVLYPGYLYNGSLVQIELRKRQGGVELIHGEVKNCRHVHASWHAVGIKFKERIFPQLFLSQSMQSDAANDEPAKIDVARLKGSLLLIDDQMMDRNLFVHLLKGSSLRVTEAASAEEAVVLVARSMASDQDKTAQATVAFDLIVCDLNLGNVPGETAILQIREKGYKGPIVVMTAETSPDRITAATAAGATSVFHKPYTADKLHSAIAAQLSERCLIIDDPIYSPLCADTSIIPMVEKYVAQVRSAATELHKCIAEDNLPEVRIVCQSLKGTGVGYGFPSLTDAATAAMKTLDASYSVAESVVDLRRLEALCGRITSAEPPAAAGARK
jgi:CheY-like chemotaxis protein